MNASSGSMPTISFGTTHDEFLKLIGNSSLNPKDTRSFVLTGVGKTRTLTVFTQKDLYLTHADKKPNISQINSFSRDGKLVKIRDCDCYVRLFSVHNPSKEAESVASKLGSKAGAAFQAEASKASKGHYAVITTFYPVTPSEGYKSKDPYVPLKPGFKQQRLEYVFCSEHRDIPLEVISNSTLEIRTRRLGSSDVNYKTLDSEKPVYSHGINLTSYYKAIYSKKDQTKHQSGAQGCWGMQNVDPFSNDGPDGQDCRPSGDMANFMGGSNFNNN
ncbi:hypothetical protein [Salinisphaera sp. G21_0]|uniref:hypothetical protein n=1 Tax=Salinisphaera sp. G21_0 TaxID=2821094 RepID=UPI001ADCCEDA|nr:hypothetical protein [Salinisphaera sp. G21_0]MBO9482519.1 hypothetical protein [Salinisphaera sp. G21_0]